MVESALTIKSLTDLKFNKKKEIENELENQVNLLDDDAASEIHEKAAPLPKEERIEFVRKAVVEARANKLPVERVNRIVDEANSLKLKGEDRVAFIAEKVVTPAGFTAVASKLVESVMHVDSEKQREFLIRAKRAWDNSDLESADTTTDQVNEYVKDFSAMAEIPEVRTAVTNQVVPEAIRGVIGQEASEKIVGECSFPGRGLVERLTNRPVSL